MKKYSKNNISNMNESILVISPHPDDACFALAGLLLKSNINNQIINVFSRKKYSRSSSFIDGEIEQVIKEEDRAACKFVKADVINLDINDAQYRGYVHLRDFLNVTWEKVICRENERNVFMLVKQKLQLYVLDYLDGYIGIPLACSHHVDHLLVRQAMIEILKQHSFSINNLFFYEDMPYSIRNAAGIETAIEECRSQGFILRERKVDITSYINEKETCIRFYKSQIGKRELEGILLQSKNYEKERNIERIWFCED